MQKHEINVCNMPAQNSLVALWMILRQKSVFSLSSPSWYLRRQRLRSQSISASVSMQLLFCIQCRIGRTATSSLSDDRRPRKQTCDSLSAFVPFDTPPKFKQPLPETSPYTRSFSFPIGRSSNADKTSNYNYTSPSDPKKHNYHD